MNLSDRMKLYEEIGTVIPNLPVMVRLDGKAFHTWTRGMQRPYDTQFQWLMDETTRFLVEESNARIGYTQSDEIILVLWNGGQIESQIMFNGRVSKLTSVLASMCTAKFNSLVSKKPLAFFDCRVWSVPSLEEACNCLLWREQDATRNSILMAAQSKFSHREIQGKDTSVLQDMLHEAGINWNDYPSRFKRGVYFQRHSVTRRFTALEIDALPPYHQARGNPDLMVTRSEIRRLDMAPQIVLPYSKEQTHVH